MYINILSSQITRVQSLVCTVQGEHIIIIRLAYTYTLEQF